MKPHQFNDQKKCLYCGLTKDEVVRQQMASSLDGCPKSDLWDRLENDFTYHAPFENQAERYTAIRSHAKELARYLIQDCPNSRELSVALSRLEEVVFWANASIARNEKKP